jgi:predicted nucleotidyltransferase
MKIELTEDHKVVTRVLPKGTQMRVSNKFGKELIDLGVAKSFDGYTAEEEVEHIVQIASDNEELPKVKKVTKKKKRTD